MRAGSCKVRVSGAFTLMEVVISVGILAVVVPLVLAMIVAGGQSSRVAREETQAALVARSVLEEIRAAQRGDGRVIGKQLSWPQFPSGSGRVVLVADRGGRLVREGDAGLYRSGEGGSGGGFLVSARGVRHHPGGWKEGNGLSKVEISVETPPAARAEDRRKFIFVQLLHRDD